MFDLGGTGGTSPELGGTVYPPVPVVPTPLSFYRIHQVALTRWFPGYPRKPAGA